MELEQELESLRAELARLQQGEYAPANSARNSESQVYQQAAIAHFGQEALAQPDLDKLLSQAMRLVAQTLQTEFSTSVYFLPQSKGLIMRAAWGWPTDPTGCHSPLIDPQTMLAYAARNPQPIIVEDWDKETRFTCPPLIRDNRVVSSLAVLIEAGTEQFGNLGVHTTTHRRFSPDDISFLQAIANILATATQRWQAQEELQEALGRERQARQAAELAAERNSRLQAVTVALSNALTPLQVAQVVVAQGVSTLGATSGAVALLTPDGQSLQLVETVGYPAALIEEFSSFPVSAPLPLADVVRAQQAVWVESVADSTTRYPHLIETISSLGLGLKNQAYASLPLEVSGRIIGAIDLGFTQGHRFWSDEREFLLTLAGQCAQALERARLYEAERLARTRAETATARLAFLADVSDLLASSLDYTTTLANLAGLITPEIADWCTIDMLGPEGLAGGQIERLAMAHADPARVRWAEEMQRTYEHDLNAAQGVPAVLRSGEAELYPVITDEMLVQTARNPQELAMLREVGFSSVMIVPLTARSQTIGVISLVSADSARIFNGDDLEFALEIARRAAQSVDNARLYREAQEAVRVQRELDYLKDLFMSTATHELRTPLTSIRGYTQLLQRSLERQRTQPLEVSSEAGTKALERNLHSVEVVMRQVGRMNDLIGELRDFTRAHKGKFELKLNPRADLLEIVQRVIEQQRTTTEGHPLTLKVSGEKFLGRLDEARLEQVLHNLVSNAMKYSPEGTPVVVSLERRVLPAEGGSATGTQSEAVVWVQDQGQGISLTEQEHIFDPFYRARAQENSGVEGLGLGLFISHQIVVQHGGHMWLESAPGAGSTFYFSLPLEATPDLEGAGRGSVQTASVEAGRL